jgi:hypothetical protein
LKIKKLNAFGFSHEILPLLLVVIFATTGVGYIIATYAHRAPPSANFTGTITQDECATSKLPIGDVGCYITVSGKVIYITHGNIAQKKPWGSLIGFSSITTDYTGSTVSVYAAVVRNSARIYYTLQGSKAYYVKLLVTQPIVPGHGCKPKPGYACPG